MYDEDDLTSIHEVKMLSDLIHDNIVTYYDAWVDTLTAEELQMNNGPPDKYLRILMEKRNRTLRDAILEKLNTEKARIYFEGIVKGNVTQSIHS